MVGLGFEGGEEAWETVFGDGFAERSGCHGVGAEMRRCGIQGFMSGSWCSYASVGSVLVSPHIP